MTKPTQAAIEAARERLAKAAEAEGVTGSANSERAGCHDDCYENIALAIALQEMSNAVGTALGNIPDNRGRVWRELLEAHFKRFVLPDPVDLLLIEARKLVSLRYNTDTGMPEIEATLRGDDDHTPAVQNCLTAIRRGMELAKVQP